MSRETLSSSVQPCQDSFGSVHMLGIKVGVINISNGLSNRYLQSSQRQQFTFLALDPDGRRVFTEL